MDFLDSIDKVLPIFFFVIWIVFGAFVKRKAGKPPSSERKPRSGGMGELRKTLQRALEEMQGSVSIDPAPEFPEPPAETVAEVVSALPMEIPEEPLAQVPEYRRENVAGPVVPTVRTDRKSLLRKGIVLSEILAPPVALRE